MYMYFHCPFVSNWKRITEAFHAIKPDVQQRICTELVYRINVCWSKKVGTIILSKSSTATS